MIEALKKWVPSAEEIIQKASKDWVDDETVFEARGVDIVCKEGISLAFYQKAKSWLGANRERRLFWIEHRPEALKRLSIDPAALDLLQNRRCRIFYFETAAQKEWIAKKIGWMSAFKSLQVFGEAWKPLIEAQHLAAQMIASDAADFGVKAAAHLKANFQQPLRRLFALDGSMQGIPAVIIGAGPSLEKNGHLLEGLQDKALLIAAGHAAGIVKARPDLAVAIDPHEPLKAVRHPDVPLCLQGRAHPKSRKAFRGEALYFPDSHFAFEAWLTQSEPMNGGWTVGNTAAAIAMRLGCDPIVFVGMDYCYKGSQKYAGGARKEGAALVKAKNLEGREVWTQNDWLMAVRWMEEIAAEHPEIRFLNATAEGLPFGEKVALEQLQFEPAGVREKWSRLVQSAPFVEGPRFEAWKESLRSSSGPASELLLEPLWNIWAHLFERELMDDPHPIPMSDKLEIQKGLFFNQVIAEHSYVVV